MDFVLLLSKCSLQERVLPSLVPQALYWIATGSVRSSPLTEHSIDKANVSEEFALSSFKVQLATKMKKQSSAYL